MMVPMSVFSRAGPETTTVIVGSPGVDLTSIHHTGPLLFLQEAFFGLGPEQQSSDGREAENGGRFQPGVTGLAGGLDKLGRMILQLRDASGV